MSNLPPPLSPPEPDPTTASTARRMSRRVLLLGGAGTVLGAAGIAAIVRRDPISTSGTNEPPAATTSVAADTAVTPPAVTQPNGGSTTAPTTTAPTTTAPTRGTPTGTADERVLVVVQLSGGNDALNTLVPLRGTYHDLRPSIGLPDDTLLTIPATTAFGLHPSLAPIAPLLASGDVGIVAGIGFDRPDRSHFAALDMWWSATPGTASGTGWLGRWLDATSSAGDVVLRATGFGGAVPALRAASASAVGVNSLAQFRLPDLGTGALGAWSSLDPAHAAAGAATEVVGALDLSWIDDRTGDGTDGEALSDQSDQAVSDEGVISRLAAAAELIITEPGVRVVHVTVDGYDTHAGQLAVHERLLGDLATGIALFRRRITDAGFADRVLLVTTSEFGRRVQENGSGGTDHGKAGVLFVVGAGVAAGMMPIHGSLDPDDTVDGDLRPVVDPRSLYASALDWLGPDPALTDELLGGTFARLPFVM